MFNIENYNVYLSRMEKSMYDKLFFVDKIFDENVTAFLDFGCADGKLISYVHSFMPHLKYIGYDNDEKMCKAARENVPYAQFYTDWDKALAQVDPSTCILNLSSVLHEIYTYETLTGITDFWKKVSEPGWAYIVARDMTRVEWWEMSATAKLRDITKVLDTHPVYKETWEKFQEVWGRSPLQVVHFFLKYKYQENWAREVRENYLPMTYQTFEDEVNSVTRYTYERVYKNIYTLPYIRHQVKQDFGFDLNGVPTHMQYIFRKNS